ncbi:replication termination factor 2-like [Homarus americanus]|uniref:Replication termination factor 2 n=1 Tax=Homarus americanus TaxID=6706 RepID=A0A8J5MPL7_HOMAM|nr:replication termination factor 2-like [Homarus americanus]KAG7159081.1 Replication termination factor 2-like [Homarus americanus]
MGCDGGTIPRRDELVKTKKKPEQKDKNSERLYRWRHCSISQTPLKKPIVACEIGRMYNKEEVLTRLLDRSAEPGMSHIKGLKDIKELNLTPNPGYIHEGANKGDAYTDHQAAEFICPVTSLEMNGKYHFSFVWRCGCVVSERALKEVKSDVCHKCGQPYQEEDVIPLNPSEEEHDAVKARMLSRRALAKAAKKAKKEGKRSADGEDNDASTSSSSKGKKAVKLSDGASSSSDCSKSSLRVNGMASAVLRDKDFKNVRSAGFSVASDPKASEVYKSLFDTHKTAQKKQSAHWVTCNPQYF